MTAARRTLETEVDAVLLEDIHALAGAEGKALDDVVSEALADLLAKRRQGTTRDHVMTAYQASHERYGSLYANLAK